jgi:hypothetical protein
VGHHGVGPLIPQPLEALPESLGNGVKALGKSKIAKLFGVMPGLAQGLLQAKQG